MDLAPSGGSPRQFAIQLWEPIYWRYQGERLRLGFELMLEGGLGLLGRAAFAATASGGATLSSYVYQLVDDAGEVVYYGITKNPATRLGRHALNPPGPFRGMQVISEALPRAQAMSLETALIRQAKAEGRFIYNIADSSISSRIPIAVPRTIQPTHTMLNPALYPR